MKRNFVGLAAGCALLAIAAPAFGQANTVTLNTGFMPDPVTVAGVSGGPVQARGVQSDCRGFIPAAPSHVLITNTGFQFLRVFAQAAGDTTLMVRGVNGTWCNDDRYGLNPGLDIALPPGRYDIYVGSYSGSVQLPYQLTLSELSTTAPGSMNSGSSWGTTAVPDRYVPAPASLLRADLPPRHGRFAMPSRPGAVQRVTGRTRGDLNASSVPGVGGCVGYVSAEPAVTFTLTRDEPFLRTFVTSASDTTLVIQGPDGSVQCNDDAFGLHPSIDMRGMPGTYSVWVGVYRPGEVRPFRLTVTTNAAHRP
jgi:hypothetical protein